MNCEGTQYVGPDRGKPCTKQATKQRREKRWGTGGVLGGTMRQTTVTYNFCADCAALHDEARREQEWEARVS